MVRRGRDMDRRRFLPGLDGPEGRPCHEWKLERNCRQDRPRWEPQAKNLITSGAGEEGWTCVLAEDSKIFGFLSLPFLPQKSSKKERESKYGTRGCRELDASTVLHTFSLLPTSCLTHAKREYIQCLM